MQRETRIGIPVSAGQAGTYDCGSKWEVWMKLVLNGLYLLNKFFTNCMFPFKVFDGRYYTNKKSSNCSKYTENKSNKSV